MNARNTRLPFSIVAAIAMGSFWGCTQIDPPASSQSTLSDAQHSRAAPLASHTMVPASKQTTPPSRTPAGRGSSPLRAVNNVAPGQAGFVHYFLLRMPDDSLEIQVGVELADQRIAWSFPDLGVAVSPFIETGEVEAGGRSYEVWHLYGLRPFPDEVAMARLRRELPARVDRWTKAGIPYCLNDAPNLNCMSCLGFVMRALFPGKNDYPAVPADFSRTVNSVRYTPNDLLLYLSGMLDLSDRNARLQRLSQFAMPPDLKKDLEELVYGMGAGDTVAATTRQRRAAAPAPKTPTPRRKL